MDAAAIVTRYMQSLLVNTKPLDLLVYLTVGVVLLGGCGACMRDPRVDGIAP